MRESSATVSLRQICLATTGDPTPLTQLIKIGLMIANKFRDIAANLCFANQNLSNTQNEIHNEIKKTHISVSVHTTKEQ